MAPPLSTQRPKPHDILGTLKARKKACGLVKGLVHLRKRLHDHTVNSRPPLKHEMGVCCTIWISEYNLDGSWWWERKSAHQGNPPKEKLYLCEVCHKWFSEKGSQHIKAVHWKRSLYLWTGTGHQKVKLYLCEVCTDGFLRKEVSTSRQSTEREAFTSGQGQATRKFCSVCLSTFVVFVFEVWGPKLQNIAKAKESSQVEEAGNCSV